MDANMKTELHEDQTINLIQTRAKKNIKFAFNT